MEWGSAGVALDKEKSGDAYVVAPFPGGVLVAVIDGLGHGADAAAAARDAARLLEAHAGDAVSELVQRCHEGLRKTRGAVMSLASFNSRSSSVTWIGIGNVEGVLLLANRAAEPSRDALAARAGVVGYQLPPLREAVRAVSSGDVLILATDGIRSEFTAGLSVQDSPQDMAESIVARYAKESDDALVLVTRYLGT
ncbi:MAG: SpoIIE family protein phosphatase [Acidobacteria bacterium]|nr:SpoIIE family protein phosphatase [Acidobacteriota bacterium]